MADEYEPLKIKKTFEASRQAVWDVWTMPGKLREWYMPEPFTVERCELDVKVDGELRIDTKGPDGVVNTVTGVFKVVKEPEELVMTNVVHDAEGNPLFEVQHSLVLTEADGKTTLDLTSEVLTAGPNAAPFLGGMEQGLQQALDQLASIVEE